MSHTPLTFTANLPLRKYTQFRSIPGVLNEGGELIAFTSVRLHRSFRVNHMTINAWHLTRIEAEARRYCRQKRITGHEEYLRVFHGMRHQAYMQEIEPLIEHKARLVAAYLPSIRISAMQNGQLSKIDIEQNPKLNECLTLLDEAIIHAAQAWGFDVSYIPTKESKP